ncbi:DNA mismatch repair protein MutS [Sphingobium herbicidovorans NBRC 16415]|uniref:DNA mismatch repair protein MutS n=1 Tax=Sphingobium herbicidovorans (strain ATCC 700291 / DSM 11019 / CCUG 56400 / KCTC 2939 / LMG 18315 / NBRC 16415 / MH) TaxID=1219045 RepID=A0A086P561_SPHHM|nr:DNA mismatch repair protein MutS [Sphingobium herbicidovorans]KFG88529.1 DNA mismatch repair protein MutS [Sphingobium herbicidovorans NBRC 16415]
MHSPKDIAASQPTPMMAQYLTLKAEAQDCLLFYRMGDFFELFFDDAKAAAATLDIALTSRGEHGGAPIPMCGVPVHSADSYLARLIKAGHRVAIAEQTETPAEAKARGGKALVARAIVRYVTAGTLTEETLLDTRRDNMLVALAQTGGDGAAEIGLAAADISTGRFETLTLRAADLPAELARLRPSEIVVPDGLTLDLADSHPFDRTAFSSNRAETALKRLFGVATLDGFGQFGRAELAAMGGLVGYLDHAGKGTLPFLAPPVRKASGAHVAIDAATRESLEIIATMNGARVGSLLGAVDRTVTGAGARMLAQDLSAPLMDQGRIEARLGLVQLFHDDPLLRDQLRAALRSLPDIGRALGRVAVGRGSPRDLGQLRDGLNEARLLRERLGRLPDQPPLLRQLLPALDGHGALVDSLTRALVPNPPTETTNGGYIADGYDPALDELRRMAGDGRRAIAALEAKYREQTGIASLKIRHNGVLGYHVEVPARAADPLMQPESGFTHRQTLAGVVRFNSIDLHEQAGRVAQAGAHALVAEAAHLEDLIESTLTRKSEIALAADALSRLDVAAALAERAAEGGWQRPHFLPQDGEGPCLEIIGGRHPVVEDALQREGQAFVANDCRLGASDRLWLVTGPNMGGKSTFLRQNALIVILAQAGAYVPAQSATLTLVDRLFSRVGASDNLARGRSTFMVEMVETAAILAQATEHSFVILDEVGRGTSTYDGLALAWAVVEAVHEVNRCRCLFATHYHELTRLAETLSALSLHHVRAREWKGDLVLLHELAQGPADRSYGLAVARLAGLPPAVLKRAKDVLTRLEAGKARTGGIAAGLDDLPLFAAVAAQEEEKVDPLRAALEAIDADALSPREALEQLYRLKQLAVAGGED